MNETPAEQASPVRRYFDSWAATYDRDSNRGWWRLLRRIESSAIERAAGDVRGLDVLELGCGAGFYTRRLLQIGAAHVCAVDFSADMLARLPVARVSPVCANISSVRLGRRFPVIVAAGVLEFIERPVDVFETAAAHADSATRFVAFMPRRGLWGRGYARFHRSHDLHVHLFDKRNVEELARSTGWTLDLWKTTPTGAAARFVRRDAGSALLASR